MEDWANGSLVASFKNEMMVRNAGAQGACSMIDTVLNYDADSIFGVEDEK